MKPILMFVQNGQRSGGPGNEVRAKILGSGRCRRREPAVPLASAQQAAPLTAEQAARRSVPSPGSRSSGLQAGAGEGNFLRNPNDPWDTPDPKDEFMLQFVKP